MDELRRAVLALAEKAGMIERQMILPGTLPRNLS
jgi:hypothetical protein